MTYTSSPLHAAVIAQRENVLLTTIEKDRAYIDMPDSFGSYPIIDAVKLNNCTIAKLLIDAGCNLVVFDSNGDSALSSACFNNNLSLVQLIYESLIRKGVNINDAIDDPNKSLLYSQRANECSKFLISKGLLDPYPE